ncbi:MAG: ABC transporter substrate-binding protein, partial [Gemmatimonadetes bacterium]|nr:ABC transporter substrate-binding protein [Gemmatimonadota bacterium]
MTVAITVLSLTAQSAPGVPDTLASVAVHRSHALGIHGEVKYPAHFVGFDYTSSDAVKGGHVRLPALGTFDSLNPFIIKGVAAAGSGSFIHARLCTKAQDEPLSEYALVAETILFPDDRSWVAFELRPEATFSDGEPIRADDVVYSFELFTKQGAPFYRSFYADVDTVYAVDSLTVRFDFSGTTNRELPLIIGQMRVLPKHYWEQRDFTKTTLDPPVGSGPYRITHVDPGRAITYERIADHWSDPLPVMRGRYNFASITYDYYRDNTVSLEAFKAGEYDFRSVGSAKEWATSYDHPAVEDGRLAKDAIQHQMIRGMGGFVFNTRRDKFADPRVRRALAYAFDFEWTNATLFYGAYVRTSSFFANSELASRDVATGRAQEILEEYRGRISGDTFGPAYQPPSTDGDGNLRSNLRHARRALLDAGWEIREGALTNVTTGETMEIEFLLSSPSYERVIGPMRLHLQRLGIDARIRTVDASQYTNRVQSFDFDIIVTTWNQYLSPGNEQRNYWSSGAADAPGSRNYAGIRDPVVDELVERLIAAQTRHEQVSVARALDRVLALSHYVIPHWHMAEHRLVYWNRFSRPAQTPLISLGFIDTWWVDP